MMGCQRGATMPIFIKGGETWTRHHIYSSREVKRGHATSFPMKLRLPNRLVPSGILALAFILHSASDASKLALK